MEGRTGVVFGIANERSYAWYIAQELLAQGARCAFTYLPGEKSQRRMLTALRSLGVEDPWLAACDVGSDEQLDALFARLGDDFGVLDFLVHSVAYADREYLQPGGFRHTPRHVWAQALDISAYSLVAMADRAAPLMTRGGSIVAMSYLGGERVVPGYNIMGVAKAALEHAARYLAGELGQAGIRVNTISGGPLRTLAAMAVPGIEHMIRHHAVRSPLRRNIEGEDVARTAVFLLSDLASAVTGETVHVDAGFHIVSCSALCETFQDRLAREG